MSTKSILSYLSVDAFENEMQKLALVGKSNLPGAMIQRILSSRDITFKRSRDMIGFGKRVTHDFKKLLKLPGKNLSQKIAQNPKANTSRLLKELHNVKRGNTTLLITPPT